LGGEFKRVIRLHSQKSTRFPVAIFFSLSPSGNDLSAMPEIWKENLARETEKRAHLKI
jgi:hypothetical protein